MSAETIIDRRDLLFPFAKRKAENQPKRTPKTSSKHTQTQPPRRNEGGRELSRRQALPLIGGGLVLTAGIATGILRPWDWLISQPKQSKPEILKPQEIDLYYPELKNYPLHSQGEFKTARTLTKWFNFSQINLQSNTTQMAFSYFEDLGKSADILDYILNREAIPFSLDVKPRTERIIFLIPQTASLPHWDDIAPTASTTGGFTNAPYIIFVKIPLSENDLPSSQVFTTIEAAINKAFTIEACQSSIAVSSLSTEMANLGQEIVCNSWGTAFTQRQLGIDFNKYSDWAKTVQIRKDASSPSFPLYILNKEDYNKIPQIGFSLTVNK